MPSKPMKNAVVDPMISTTESAVSDNSNSGDMRATMKMPAVTMVAAWIRSDAEQTHEKRGGRSDDQHHGERRLRQFEQRRHARHHEDARRHHGRGMDQI